MSDITTPSSVGDTPHQCSIECNQPCPMNTSTHTESGGSGNYVMLIILAAVWLFILFSMRKQRREANVRKSMQDTLKKGDSVMTVGGLFGTIVELDSESFTVMIDDRTGARARFIRSALARNLSNDEAKS